VQNGAPTPREPILLLENMAKMIASEGKLPNWIKY
jgi:hypothetical protein